MFERSRAHDQRALDAAQVLEQRRRGDGLNRLAQTHVVGQQRATAKGQMHGALLLIRIQLRGEHVERALAAFDLIEEPRFLLRHRLSILQQSQMFAHTLIDAHQRSVTRRQLIEV
jgi:hypothetical protein